MHTSSIMPSLPLTDMIYSTALFPYVFRYYRQSSQISTYTVHTDLPIPCLILITWNLPV